MSVLLEVCVDSPAGLEAAVAGGAGRIELCSALDLGGLTPSRGMIELAAQQAVPVHALIRPRSGGFVYSRSEVDVMLTDIEVARASGLAGVVVGAARSDGGLDLQVLRRLCEYADGLSVTLHRVFDLVPDPGQALEDAIDLGIDRILTSGGGVTVLGGLHVISSLCRQAAGRISILPGAGVTADNVAELIETTGVSEVHASCRTHAGKNDERLVALGFATDMSRNTSEEQVRALKQAMDGVRVHP
ncbi:copper homeostasis protein CutC [Trinickia dinghuensis]|uniref:PF03932 family protein CutC n=1 Tax=Trinickia dinghuensis TaxID=2291023 RepID=A0A3D8JPT0_9BURK|nr:copper homeostasis protein CutC [Trinickia dinghuensis]RDU95123.1 copper homeostasis protein CutC [Trinickia dinghuensis]